MVKGINNMMRLVKDTGMAKEKTDISQLITEAKKGNLTAQLTLAGIYEEGLGETQDFGLAARWFVFLRCPDLQLGQRRV